MLEIQLYAIELADSDKDYRQNAIKVRLIRKASKSILSFHQQFGSICLATEYFKWQNMNILHGKTVGNYQNGFK